MEITTATIKEKVTTDRRWADRALLALYARQTASEQTIGETVEKNGRGFSGADAEILSSFASQLKNGRQLSDKQYAIVFRKLGKYANQLYKVAQGD